MKNSRFKKALPAALTVLLSAVFFLSVPSGVLGREETSPLGKNQLDNYLLGPGDLVQVVVWKNEEVSGNFRIRPDGKFSMPLIGDILAEGSTTDGVSMQVEQKLKLFIESPFVSTIVLETKSNRIYILGEIKNPGTYSIDGSLTVLQALALAGGFTPFANKDKMILVRGIGKGQRNIPISYSRILRTPGEENNPTLERGDTLVVP